MTLAVLALLLFTAFVLRMNVFSFLFLISLFLAFKNGLSYEQIKYLISISVERIIGSEELISIPLYIFLSLILIRYGIFDSVLKFLGKIKSNFLRLFLILFSSTLFLPSAVISNKQIISFLKRNSDMKNDDILVFSHFFSIFAFVSPISIPILVYSFLLKLSLKSVFLYFYLLSFIFFIFGYFLLFKNKVIFFKRGNFKLLDIIFFTFLFFIFIYMIFVPYSIFEIMLVLIIITICYILISGKWDMKINLLIINEVLERSGVIISLLIMLFFINILIVYGGYDYRLSNLFLSIFSDKYVFIIILLLISYILIQFLDPLAVIIILYPFYKIIINEFSLNKYVFGFAYLSFVTLGFFSLIENLLIQNYIDKLGIGKSRVNELLLKIMIYTGLFSIITIYFV
ncbi:hypothetical protein OWM07_07510 [Deferribacter thermophilus]|uniref:hypothetical protein n=1 Tax=Deferribacter thermophilus TaxID=53573 RepID=UPI003C21E2DC